MAVGDTAAVFVETSLGTRLVVSLPARATTVADLKRQVSAEHAACFRSTGPIAVKSLQVKLDGSWFQLTDSLAVQAAFEWVKGPWRLLAEAHVLRPHPGAHKDAKCGTDDGEPNAGQPVIAGYSSQYMLPPAEALGVGNHAPGNAISDSPQMENQQGKAQGGGEHASDQSEDGITMPQESPDLDLASGGSDTPPMDQEDKSHEGDEDASGQLEDGVTMAQEHSDSGLAAGDSDTLQQDKAHEDVEHASGQLEDGIAMPQECSDSDLAAGNSDTLMNLQDKSHEGVENASGQGEDRPTKPQQSTDLGVASDKGNGPVGSQQKDIIAEPRGKKRFREEESSDLGVAADKGNGPVGSQQTDIIMEPRGKKRFRKQDKADESIVLDCDYNLTSFASSTLKVVPEKKSSVTEQAKSSNVPLLYNLQDCSDGLREKHSGGQKEPWTSRVLNGESSNNGSNILPCVKSMERHKSSDKGVQAQRGDKEEPKIDGCAGRTEVPQCVESMKEDDKGPASNGHYFDKGKNEGSTSTISKGYEPCFRTSHQRLAVRKVPMSRAAKTYAVRC